MKLFCRQLVLMLSHVAPRAGAWIETIQSPRIISFMLVAPRAGAWIETHFLLMCLGRK